MSRANPSVLRRLASERRWGVYGSFNRNVYILLLFTLGKGFQLSIGALTLNLYVHSLGFNLQFVGLFAATSAIGALLAAIPVGILADHMGRKSLLLVSGFTTPLTLVMTAFSTTAVPLLISGLLNGLLASAYWVTYLPILTDSTTEEQRVAAMALNNFLLLGVGALGALVGGEVPQVVGLLLHQSPQDTIPLRWGILAAALIVFLPVLPLFSMQVPKVEHTAPRPLADASYKNGKEASRGAIVALFIKLLVPDILFTTGEGAVVGLLSLFFFLRFALQPGPLGLLFTLAGLVGGASSLAAPRVVRNWGQLRMATAMQFLTVPALLLTGFSPFLLLAAAGEFVRQILRGLFEPVYATFAMGRVSGRYRGTLSGFYSLTWSVGYSIGPITAGWLQQNVGLSSSFVIAAACVGLSGVLLRLFFSIHE